MRILTLCALLLTLAGCGIKGALVLPERQASPAVAPAQPAVSVPTAVSP